MSVWHQHMSDTGQAFDKRCRVGATELISLSYQDLSGFSFRYFILLNDESFVIFCMYDEVNSGGIRTASSSCNNLSEGYNLDSVSYMRR